MFYFNREAFLDPVRLSALFSIKSEVFHSEVFACLPNDLWSFAFYKYCHPGLIQGDFMKTPL